MRKRRSVSFLVAGCALVAVLVIARVQEKEKRTVKILRTTPILVVDKIEPHLDFYEKRLGYKRLAEVPQSAGGLGFVMLEQNNLHLMMQTRASIAEDLGTTAADAESREKLMRASRGEAVVQFVVVESIDAVIESMKGVKHLVPLRTTNYGMKEIVVQDTAGFVIVFAQEIAQ